MCVHASTLPSFPFTTTHEHRAIQSLRAFAKLRSAARALTRAAKPLLRRVLCLVVRACSWFVDKVTKVARPMRSPKIQEMSPLGQQEDSEGPLWRETLSEMSELPTHLVGFFPALDAKRG